MCIEHLLDIILLIDCFLLGLCRLFSSCGQQQLLSNCGVWVSHCGAFFLQSMGSSVWASVVAAYRLSSVAPRL